MSIMSIAIIKIFSIVFHRFSTAPLESLDALFYDMPVKVGAGIV